MSPLPPSSNPVAAALLGRVEASIMAESALIDKESGRVFWEGGSSSTLSASLYPKIGLPGFSHFKATVLSSLLFLALVSVLSQWVQQKLEGSRLGTTTTTTTATQGIARPLHQTIGVFLLQWTLFRTPNFDGAFVIVLVLLYLVEAYTCSTRRYLANAILSSTSEVEEFIEKLREEPPVVRWKVRCFHYEKPYCLSPIKTAQSVLKAFTTKTKISSNITGTEDLPPVLQKESDNVSGPFRRKVISHEAVANYTFSRYVIMRYKYTRSLSLLYYFVSFTNSLLSVHQLCRRYNSRGLETPRGNIHQGSSTVYEDCTFQNIGFGQCRC